MNIPVVSVVCTVYNHKRYVTKALDSFLMQRTNFPFEIIVHDDCSTDGTQDIVRSYEAKNSDIIRGIYQPENVYSTGKKIWPIVFPMCRGKYIALCEGDDYWTDSTKLQRQFDYLEARHECSGVFTDIRLVDEEENILREVKRMPEGMTAMSVCHFMQGNAVHTANIFFRKHIIDEEAMDFISRMPYGDMSLYLICSLWGPIGYIPLVTSAYRVNVGVMRKVDKAQRARNSMYIRESFIRQYGNDLDLKSQYNVGVKKYYLDLSSGEFRNGNFVAGFRAYVLFWCSTIYRIIPRYPILKRIEFMHHFRPLREFLAFLRKQLKAN